MPSMPVRIGVQIQPQHADFDEMRRAWREAEELGVDSIFNWDHFYPLYGEPDGEHFEALTSLASLAEVTERVQIGSLVICNSTATPICSPTRTHARPHLRRPLILGIGAGWFERDYDEYGYEFGTVGDRCARSSAALPRIKARWPS